MASAPTIPMLEFYCYLSRARGQFSEASLVALQAQGYRFNQEWEATSILAYKNGHFAQLIEAPPPAMIRILERVRTSARHHHMVRMSGGPLTHRLYEHEPLLLALTPDELHRCAHALMARLQVADDGEIALSDAQRDACQQMVNFLRR